MFAVGSYRSVMPYCAAVARWAASAPSTRKAGCVRITARFDHDDRADERRRNVRNGRLRLDDPDVALERRGRRSACGIRSFRCPQPATTAARRIKPAAAPRFNVVQSAGDPACTALPLARDRLPARLHTAATCWRGCAARARAASRWIERREKWTPVRGSYDAR